MTPVTNRDKFGYQALKRAPKSTIVSATADVASLTINI